jgi:large subunit ribosomal protein L22
MATRQKTKALARKENADKRPKAIAKYIRISPYKVRVVLDTIRGKSYEEAVALLTYSKNTSAEAILKVLNSAAANAENNLNLSKRNLYVAETYADQGPTLKRIQPRAQGRAFSILKRTSHITVILDEIKEN